MFLVLNYPWNLVFTSLQVDSRSRYDVNDIVRSGVVGLKQHDRFQLCQLPSTEIIPSSQMRPSRW